MLAFGAEEDEEIFHSVKFIEDVPLIVIVEIGRTVMEVQNVLNLKKDSMVVFEKNSRRTHGYCCRQPVNGTWRNSRGQ